MKALVFTEPGRVEVQELGTPQAGPQEVLVRVSLAGICGSDLGGFLGHQPRRRPPLVLGHELLGVVVETNEPPFTAGQRVTVNPLFSCFRCSHCLEGKHNLCQGWRLLGMDNLQGSLAEYVCVPSTALYPISDDVPDETAALAEPLACGVHLLSLSKRQFGSMAIFGAGTQGTLALLLARSIGYRDIIVSDPNEHDQRTQLNFADIVRREICLHGSFAYTMTDFQCAVDLLGDGLVDIRPWTTVRPLEEGQAAFEKMVSDPGPVIKTLLRP